MPRLRHWLPLVLALSLPTAAQACPVCGNHGDTTLTLLVYGGFMVMPFLLVGGVGFAVYRQVRQLPPDTGRAAAAPGLEPSPTDA